VRRPASGKLCELNIRFSNIDTPVSHIALSPASDSSFSRSVKFFEEKRGRFPLRVSFYKLFLPIEIYNSSFFLPDPRGEESSCVRAESRV
jgi:hypothetical protein